MDTTVILQAFFIVLLILMSAFFSSTETSYSSVNRVRVKARAESGDKRASLVMKLADNFDELLGAILVGNNIVNIAATALATALFTRLMGPSGVTVSTIVMTVLVLLFGEITPKSFAKEMPEKLAYKSAPVMNSLVRLLKPVNFLFVKWKGLIKRIAPESEDAAITEEELITYIDEAEDDGGIDEHESQLIRSAIEFHDRDVSEVLTPRVDIEAIPDDATDEEIAARFEETNYSRLPVYHGSIDNIIGFLHERDFYMSKYRGRFSLSGSVKRVMYVQGRLKISALMRRLQLEKMHMAIVLDEFGGTLGLVTLEDVIEELVGEIWDEHDEVIEFFEHQPDGSVLVNAGANLEDMFDEFDWGKVDDDIEAVTASGWAIEKLGRIPQPGDSFRYDGHMVVVSRTEKRRVIELKVLPVADENPDDGKEESKDDVEKAG